MEINHLPAIVWHLRNGEDNAGLSREALADYLECVNQEIAPDMSTDPEYQRFVESQVKHCRCSRNRPCDGVLAGGPCDDIQHDYEDDLWFDEWWRDQED